MTLMTHDPHLYPWRDDNGEPVRDYTEAEWTVVGEGVLRVAVEGEQRTGGDRRWLVIGDQAFAPEQAREVLSVITAAVESL